MSLVVVIKAPEGLVLAADSRVTYTKTDDIPDINNPGQNIKLLVPYTFDNAAKVLSFDRHNYVGAVTYDAAEIGERTANSFIPEFLDEIDDSESDTVNRLTVEEFAQKLSDFFKARWDEAHARQPIPPDTNMRFVVGGFDIDDPYAKLYSVIIPSTPAPTLLAQNEFTAIWDGVRDIPDRIFNSMDYQLQSSIEQALNLNTTQKRKLEEQKQKHVLPVIVRTLALQDCVKLALTILRTTIDIQALLFTPRTVGGNIDIAIITKEEGLQFIQKKKINGEVKNEQ